MSGRPLLTIPARAPRPGDATFVDPHEPRPPLRDALRIASFEGTSFVDEWLGYAADPAKSLPDLVPFRDWSEPPDELLDATGEPIWAPGAVLRGEPINGVSNRGTAGVLLDPDGVPSADVPWLRKLYLPSHDRFHIVGARLVCRQPTLPSVTRSRVQEVGVIIRRVAFDTAGQVRHLDWVSGAPERGLWVDLGAFGVEASNSPSGGRERLDPTALPNDSILKNLVAGTTDATIEVRTSRGAVLARKNGDARTVAWAVLPLTSSEQEVHVEPGFDTLAEYANDLVADLAPAFEGVAADLHASVATPLIELVSPLIPTAPPAAAVATARTLVNTVSFGNADAITSQMVETFRTDLWADAAAHLSSHASWTAAAYSAAFAAVPPLPIPTSTLRVLLEAELAALWAPLRTALETRAILTTDHQRELLTWSAIIAQRVRECRISLVDDIYAALGDAFGEDFGDLPDAQGDISASTLALELDNWIFADQNRALTPRPWVPFGFYGSHRLVFHEKAREMERTFASIRARLTPAGAAYEAALIGARPALSQFLIDGFTMSAGLDWEGELESGLLVWPTAHLTDAELAAFVGPFGRIRTQAANPAVTDLAVLRANAERQLRPRFDTAHLYVAQLFARVAGTHRCDPVDVVWSEPTEPFTIAAHGDLLGIRPVAIEAPNLPKLLADIPRMARAGANPFAHVLTPPSSGYIVGEDPTDTRRSWDIAMICSFGIPVFTICAMIVFKIIFQILLMIPGFVWMLLLKFCLPIPRRS